MSHQLLNRSPRQRLKLNQKVNPKLKLKRRQRVNQNLNLNLNPKPRLKRKLNRLWREPTPGHHEALISTPWTALTL